MDFTIGSGALNNLSDMASGVGTGVITNIGLMTGVIATIVVVLFSKGLIMRGLHKLGF